MRQERYIKSLNHRLKIGIVNLDFEQVVVSLMVSAPTILILGGFWWLFVFVGMLALNMIAERIEPGFMESAVIYILQPKFITPGKP